MSNILKDVENMKFDNLQDLISKEDKKEFETIDKWFESVHEYSKQINMLSNVKSSIETYGITNDIISNNKDMMWDNFEFDLEMFRNPTHAQVTICLESIGQTLANIIKRAIEIIDKIIDFLMVDSGFARYINKMETYRHVVNEKLTMMKDFSNDIDVNKLNNCVITMYTHESFDLIKSSIANLIPKLTSIDISKTIPSVQDLANDFVSEFRTLGVTLGTQGGVKTASPVNYIRRDSCVTLRWNQINIKNAGDSLSTNILANAATVTKARYTIVRAMRNFRVTLVDFLNGRTTAVNPKSDIETAGCNALKNILKDVIVERSCGLAYLWVTMVNTIYSSCKK